jgi:hypothetical protein
VEIFGKLSELKRSFDMKNKVVLVGMLALVFIIGCDDSVTNEDVNSKSITITGISDDKNWAYARIGIFPNFDDEFNVAVTQFVPILNGKTTGELKLVVDTVVSDVSWTGNGEYYVEVLLTMEEKAYGPRALYLYTNGANLDENNVPKYNITNAITTLPFSAFKKEGEIPAPYHQAGGKREDKSLLSARIIISLLRVSMSSFTRIV